MLEALHIRQFRNLYDYALQPHPAFNLIHGKNGSGKTSILEAIYYLAYTRSFRTAHIPHLIHHDHASFSLRAELATPASTYDLYAEKSHEGPVLYKIADKRIRTLSQISKHLPIRFIDTNSHRHFAAAPKNRRYFIDWGMFHVEHQFLSTWKQYQHCLKQRNSSLKQRQSTSAIQSWDAPVIAHGTTLHALRAQHVQQLTQAFHEEWKAFDIAPPITLAYLSGWPTDQSFEQALCASLYKDREIGHTSVGPHRSDLSVLCQDMPAFSKLSQGQQKLAFYALSLAQTRLINTHTASKSIYLIDDLAAELDDEKRAMVISKLSDFQTQCFITAAIQQEIKPALPTSNTAFFDLEIHDISSTTIT